MIQPGGAHARQNAERARRGRNAGTPDLNAKALDVAVPSEALNGFIRSTIKSVWALELLLLISRERKRSWTPEDLNRELRGSLALVTEIIAKFRGAGLIADGGDGTYRYEPQSVELDKLVRELEAAYAARPLAVVRAIVAAPNEKIQTLADAIKVKKD